MNIQLADQYGFCYGVRRALEMAFQHSASENPVYTLGPIIHNAQVVRRLEESGIYTASSIEKIPDNGIVIIRSHGVGPAVYQYCEEKNIVLVDATCPHVKKAQQAAQNLYTAGYQVVIAGEKDHPEVHGIWEWTDKTAVIVATEKEIDRLEFNGKVGLVAQTTFSRPEFEKITKALQKYSQDVTVKNTICQATGERQEAARNLAAKSDVIFVVGGRNSANTARLHQICSEAGVPSYHIETAEEIQKEWLRQKKNVGVTAGASTPDDVIKEVVEAIQRMGVE